MGIPLIFSITDTSDPEDARGKAFMEGWVLLAGFS